MSVVYHLYKIDVLKMEHTFHFGYCEGDKVVYVFALNWKGEEEVVDAHKAGWNTHWILRTKGLRMFS
jgi:hypothetical protein